MCRQLDIQQEVVPGIATAFGGGIGGTGSVCGALVGAVMAIGLRHGRQLSSERDARAYALTQQMRRRFEGQMGHVDCRELTGMDLSTAEGVKRFYASDVPRRVCLPAVGVAYRAVMELLGEKR
ncbi:MAG: C_GCAxxG_C_C family protein [Candidatus Rokubacteria bacterium]|nr:C_GCAxxG_C_C family protein [Candidatus Rokubacteria bacterium]